MYIHGAGHFHPENIIDNAFLEGLDIGVDSAWILQRVGIHQRRTVLPLDYIRTARNRDPRAAREAALYSNADTATRAARLALYRAGLQARDIGMVISGSSAPQVVSPAEACPIAMQLGIEAAAFDINSACSSFVVQLATLNMMKEESLPDFILVVNPESLTSTVDYTDRTNAVLMGDSAAAVVLSTRVPARMRLMSASIKSQPSGWDKVVIPAAGYLRQEGSAVQRFAIKRTVETLSSPAVRTQDDNFYFIGHQANLTMLQAVCAAVPVKPDRHLFNVDQFGNCGSAGAPSVLSQNWETLNETCQIRMAVVGAGLTWGGAPSRRRT